MEMLMLSLLAVSCFLIWRKPQREKLAWGLFLAASAICVFLFILDVHTYLVPMGNI